MLARQAEREKKRIRHRAAWQLPAAGASAVEGRLSSADYELRAGDDGLPVWTFGGRVPVAEITIRTDQDGAGMTAEINLSARRRQALTARAG